MSPVQFPPKRLWALVLGSAIVLLAAAAARHELLHSSGFDLGIYDQVAYLLGRGLPPYSTISDLHHFGNHAAYSFLIFALPYHFAPSVYWLLGVQALALALGAIPAWALARQANLAPRGALAIAGVYLLYPVVFNVNLYDFHPEVMAIAPLLAALWAARAGRVRGFAIAVVWILGCKAVLALTVAALGVWLWGTKAPGQRRFLWPPRSPQQQCGAIALGLGLGWFVIANAVVIPWFNRGDGHEAIGRYAYLGSSVGEAAKNVLLRPDLVLSYLVSLDTLSYGLLVALPLLPWLLWALWRRVRHRVSGRSLLGPLVPMLPTLLLNSLSTSAAQRDLVHQYSLPLVPFGVLMAIELVRVLPHDGPRWWISGRGLMVWAAVSFLLLAKYGYFGSIYLSSLETWAASRAAIAQVTDDRPVLTTSELIPHLSQRAVIRQTDAAAPPNLAAYDWLVFNLRHPGWGSSPEFAARLVSQARSLGVFRQVLEQDGVIVFRRSGKRADPI